MPGGLAGHNIMCACCLFFCLAFAFLNGTDYFLGGFIVMLAIPAVYVICKWVWKGATVKEPELYPTDPRTKLGFGDVTKLGGYYTGFGVLGFIARVFLQWFEEDELLGYFVQPWEIGWEEFEVMAEFPELTYKTEGGEHYVPGWYEQLYTSGLFSDFYAMLDVILYLSAASAIAGVVLLILGKRLKKAEAL